MLKDQNVLIGIWTPPPPPHPNYPKTSTKPPKTTSTHVRTFKLSNIQLSMPLFRPVSEILGLKVWMLMKFQTQFSITYSTGYVSILAFKGGFCAYTR